MIITQTRASQAYKERVDRWIAGRTFYYVNPVVLPGTKIRCDACGCRKVKTFFVVQDEAGVAGMVGRECFELLTVRYKSPLLNLPNKERQAIADELVAQRQKDSEGMI
jgi:hypothetical protein